MLVHACKLQLEAARTPLALLLVFTELHMQSLDTGSARQGCTRTGEYRTQILYELLEACVPCLHYMVVLNKSDMLAFSELMATHK